MKKTLVWLCIITQAYSFPTNPPNTESGSQCCDNGPQLIYKGYDNKHRVNIFVFKFLPSKQEPTTENKGEIGGEKQTDNGLDYEATKDVVEEVNREIHISTIFPKIVTTEEASESPKGISDNSSQDEDVIPEHGYSTTLIVTKPTLKNKLDEQVTITHDKNIVIENVGGVTDFESEDYIIDVEDIETQISTILPQVITTEETDKFPKVINDISSQGQVVTPKYSYTTESGITETTLKHSDDEQAAVIQEKNTGAENGRTGFSDTNKAGKTKESDKGARYHLETVISSQDQVVTPEYSYTADLGVTEVTLKHTDGEKARITQEKNTGTEISRVFTDYFSEDNTAGEMKGSGNGISSKDQGIFISTFAAGHGDTAEYHGTQVTNTDNTNIGINNENRAAGSIKEDSAYIQIPSDQTDYSAGRKVDLYPVDGKPPNFTDCIKNKHLCKNIKHTEESESTHPEGDCHTSILGCDQEGKRQKNKKDRNPKANPGRKAIVLGKDCIGSNDEKVKENYNSRFQSIYRTIIFGRGQRQRNMKSPGLLQNSKKSSSESSSESNSDSRQRYR